MTGGNTPEERRKIIDRKLAATGETLYQWAQKRDLHYRVVVDVIEGRVRGIRGIALQTKKKMVEEFGDIFSD